MRTRGKLATLLASATLASTALVAGAAPVSATGPCGSSYSRVGAYAVPESGTRKGTLEVYYNSSTGKNCALMYGYGSTANTTTWKSVRIQRSDNTGLDQDGGNYKYYAGPVYVSAPGQCIDVEGSVGQAGVSYWDVHCG
ncbi:spore-associated protein A [Nonomuraea deserti]|uniref:Spore-associated protein A n=1 Tax=Nonomuraea deserti TaxID=1848322 RepID=A0A4R4VUQ6_9ACTN|nr:spore-associated protein A [Nonomuraea deserti]TDD06155.1 spore-associated protein A [Nonomuraea deserti]